MFRIAIVEITNECNLNCKYCYENAGKTSQKRISLDDFSYFVAHNRGLYQDIMLSGGEPFLHPSWIEFATVLREQNMKVNFITNGTGIERIMDSQEKIDTLIISIDSFSVINNLLRNSQKLCSKDKILKLKKSKLVQNIYLQVILNKLSARRENLLDLIDFCGKYQIGIKAKLMDVYDFNATKQYALSPKEVTSTREFLHEQSAIQKINLDISIPSEYGNEFCDCYLMKGYGNIRIRSDGSIFPCEKMDDEQYKIGTLRDSEDTILFSYRKVQNALLARIIKYSRTICADCKFNGICSKGCPVLHGKNIYIDKCKKGNANGKYNVTI